jgi:hypothetical protein
VEGLKFTGIVVPESTGELSKAPWGPKLTPKAVARELASVITSSKLLGSPSIDAPIT